MNILIIEPYYTGSHAAWAEGFAKNSCHQIEILSMEGRYWKWRMHGGAVTLAKKYMEGEYEPDLLLATDMLDLTTFLSLTRSKTANIPTAIYFHENQLSYPWSPNDRDLVHKRDRHYGFINFSSALTADAIFFNSEYHRASFLGELKLLLKNFPDYNELDSVDKIEEKSSVLFLGMDLKKLERVQVDNGGNKDRLPLILWNHRWEYDKNPADFFNALYELVEKGLDFEVALVGENFRKKPDEFLDAKSKLGSRIINFGFLENYDDYARLLWQADVFPVTSNQDFFGGSVVEAMFCNCFPILPRRLAYGEHIPGDSHNQFFYSDFGDLVSRLDFAITNIDQIRSQEISPFVERYDWNHMAPIYDVSMETLFSPQ